MTRVQALAAHAAFNSIAASISIIAISMFASTGLWNGQGGGRSIKRVSFE